MVLPYVSQGAFPVVVGMDNMATQLVLTVLIIDHLTVVHQCLDACDEILGVLSWLGYDVFEFSEVHMGVDIICHSCWIQLRKAEAFTLVASIAHESPGFGSQGCKDISELVLVVRHDAVEENPEIWRIWNMEKEW